MGRGLVGVCCTSGVNFHSKKKRKRKKREIYIKNKDRDRNGCLTSRENHAMYVYVVGSTWYECVYKYKYECLSPSPHHCMAKSVHSPQKHHPAPILYFLFLFLSFSSLLSLCLPPHPAGARTERKKEDKRGNKINPQETDKAVFWGNQSASAVLSHWRSWVACKV